MNGYQPRGKVAALLEHLRKRAHQVVWSADELAQIMEIPRGNIPAYTRTVIEHAMLYRKLEHGKSLFSLQPFAPAPAGAWTAPKMVAPRGEQQPTGAAPSMAERRPAEAPQPRCAPYPPEPTPRPAVVEKLIEQAKAHSDAVIVAAEMEPIEVEEEFDAWLRINGELVVAGAQLNTDGSFTLNPEQTTQLCRLLHGQGPEA